ncbi:hypothetical protein BK004_04215 [bacterium CG10_46_32]|nr:MAG: hypothetical protein BK004_04215 [bacterium CG10_46_32]PIR55822.1 MAG: hypothetical protein COU73_04255 [Parcubacteria group bacterium CG10_big_fil_rev_8_21_14_0_10_46_32]
MNHEQHPFKNITVPTVSRMASHRRRLKVALLTAHERRSGVQAFGRIINDFIKPMSLGKKSTALATVAVFGLVVTAGVFGPSASEVAQAEATNTVKRAFAHFVNLSDEEKTSLDQKFQGQVHFKEAGEMMFHGMDEISVEEREAKHAEMKASLADSLVEAQAAADLEVISSDEMPLGGFWGKAGRAFGMKMMRKTPKDIANLPEEIQSKIKEHEDLRAEMAPAKFLRYTNSSGKQVTLGLNANDEPMMKFVEGELPFSGGPEGMMRGHGGPKGWFEKRVQ